MNVIQSLEPRRLLAAAPAPSPALQTAPTVHVRVDYSLDTNNFFDTQAKRDLLQQAADLVAGWFRDELLAIVPGGGDTWDAVLDHPATGLTHEVSNMSVAADEVVLFAGGRDMTDALGRGGPGGFRSRGSASWSDRVRYRGQAQGGDFGPWGGAIAFDTNPVSPWHFGTSTTGLAGANDFYSVAAHEVAHLFGFGTSDAWSDLTVNGGFSGAAAKLLHDGSGNVPVAPDDAHYAEGVRDEGREVAMDPQITVGTRRLLTPLDYAALDDIGWTMPPRVAASPPGVSQPSTSPHEVVVTYSHYAAIDADSFQQDGDVYAVTPGGALVPATYSRMALATDTTSADVTYTIAPPGGSWDAADNGTWSLVLARNAVLSTTGEAVAGGTLATFAVDVADAPVGTLQPVAQPVGGSASHTIAVVYTDAVAVDPLSIDAGDIQVVGPADEVLVTAAAVDSASPGSPRIATYTLEAPGGTWGPEDDGEYNVYVRAGELRDTSGNASALALAGTFEVSLGAITFDARTPATYVDASGDAVRISLKGPGTGKVRFAAARPADALEIVLDGTTGVSSLSIKASGGGTPTGAVFVNGPIKSITGKAADLTGDLSIAGSVRQVRLRNVAGANFLTIADGGLTSLAFGNVSNLAVDSGSEIRSIRAASWRNTDDVRDVISAPAVGSIRTAGEFSADVQTRVLGSLRAGTLASSDVLVDDSIGTVRAAAITGSRIFAGVRSGLEGALPNSIDDLGTSGSIRALSAGSFTASSVAAAFLGKVSLGVAAGAGVAADHITSLVARPSETDRPTKLKNLDAPGSVPVIAGVEVRVF
jgi:hypothetical protein